MGFLHLCCTTLNSPLDLLNLPCTPLDMLHPPRILYTPCILPRPTAFPISFLDCCILHPSCIPLEFTASLLVPLHPHGTCISTVVSVSPLACSVPPTPRGPATFLLDLLYILHPLWACCISHSVPLPATSLCIFTSPCIPLDLLHPLLHSSVCYTLCFILPLCTLYDPTAFPYTTPECYTLSLWTY